MSNVKSPVKINKLSKPNLENQKDWYVQENTSLTSDGAKIIFNQEAKTIKHIILPVLSKLVIQKS